MKPRKPNDEKWGRGRRPVINVSWDDAKAYAKWLSHRTAQAYRLLSEAEGNMRREPGRRRPSGGAPQLRRIRRITPATMCMKAAAPRANTGGRSYRSIVFEPNPWGLYQVHGNVWEWCEDIWRDSYIDKPEELKLTGGAWTIGGSRARVLRGGSYVNYPRSLRAACRFLSAPVNRNYSYGFRLARTLNP